MLYARIIVYMYMYVIQKLAEEEYFLTTTLILQCALHAMVTVILEMS